MTISPVNSYYMSPIVMSYQASAAATQMDAEYQSILNQLKQLGISPKGDKEADKILLQTALKRIENQQKAQESSESKDYIPFLDIMRNLNIESTGDIDKDYNATIKEIDRKIRMSSDEDEQLYYQEMRTTVETSYQITKSDKARTDLFIGASQISSINKFFMLS